MHRITTLFFDFGGVIADSPFANLSRYERERDLPADFIRLTNADNPDTNAWACFERGEIDLDEFDQRFRAETRRRGHEIPGRDLIPLLQVSVRPAMITLLDQLRSKGLRLACLTNNLPVGEGPGMSQDTTHAGSVADALKRFELVLESCRVGTRKPEPAFFQIACEKMRVSPEEVLFLDDLGINLKPARAMGMTTIKVVSAEQAIEALSGF
ncbi:MAG: HAD family hydrolase [Gammaproteobacteria bacterium HGW-Gammaproteobacteria-14]|nr:MAG: HAD family hydrolase [Gammaproteobacteria bacterium HGW-Gammaproteobacteria-14]